MVFVSLMVATLVSEDAACLAAGLLIREGRIDAAGGVIACGLGILLGDVGLWSAGRTARHLPLSHAILRKVTSSRGGVERLLRNPGPALVASRFVPGSRLPLYLAAGFGGVPVAAFIAWTLVGVIVWTPLLVLSAAGVTSAVAPPLSGGPGGEWPFRVLLLAGVLGLLWLARRVAARGLQAIAAARGARRAGASVSHVRWSSWIEPSLPPGK